MKLAGRYLNNQQNASLTAQLSPVGDPRDYFIPQQK